LESEGYAFGEEYYQLVASEPRTRGNGSGGAACSQMPVTNDKGSGRAMRMLSDGAKLSGYPTPT